MLRRIPDTVCKVLASASCSSFSRGLSLSSLKNCGTDTGEKQWRLLARMCAGHSLLGGAGNGSTPSFLLVCRRSLSSLSQGQEGSFESFSAEHVAVDGRVFRFATVVVPVMSKGESVVQAWCHARSLIGGSPTLAVAFVSKPTKSAIEAVKELAQLLSDTRKNNLVDEQQSSAGAQVSGWPGRQVQAESEDCNAADMVPPGIRIASIHTDVGRGEARTDGMETKNDDAVEQENIPLIGCVGTGWGGEFGNHWRLVGSVPRDSGRNAGLGAGAGLQTSDTSHMGKRTLEKFLLPDGRPGILCDFQTAKDLFGDLSGDRDRFLAVAADVLGDGSDDEDTLSDWEHFSAEAMEPETDAESENIGDTGTGQELEMQEGRIANPANSSVESLRSRERVSFGGASAGVAASGSVELHAQNQEHHSIDCDRFFVASGDSWSGRAEGRSGAENAYRDGADGESLPQAKRRKHVVPSKEGSGRLERSSDEVHGTDESYRLTLCLGHLPGAKAISFYSPSTGLPLLPNLEDAVTTNNPHMLLLGAPGFKFPEFIQRLSSVFPNSCRAGAFLAPLFSSIRSQWTKVAEQQAGPIFHGVNMQNVGVVGLAVSSSGNGEVPVKAFGEFVRMSLGMPRIRGYTYLDESISKSLFFPQNVSVEHLTPGQRESSPDPRSVLDYLNKFLIRNNSVSLEAKELQVSEQNREAGEVGRVKNTEDSSTSSVSSSPNSRTHAARQIQAEEMKRVPLGLFDTVIFPGWSMPLHIFEPRYRLMVKQCVEEGKPFGLSNAVTSVHSESLDSQEIIGTLVNLKVHLFEKDCRSYIIAHGVKRFRVADKVFTQQGSFGLALGQALFFDDKVCETAKDKRELADLAKEAVALCLRIIPEAADAPGLAASISDPKIASFALGHLLPVPTLVKTRWLGMVDTKARLLEQMTFLETKAKK